MFSLSNKSRAKLVGVHPDLVKVVELAIQQTTEDFAVGEGVRELARQRELVAAGKSQTMNSRHLTGHAVDLWVLVGGQVTWGVDHYQRLAKVVMAAGASLGIPIEWGGVWRTIHDYDHFQLPKDRYP